MEIGKNVIAQMDIKLSITDLNQSHNVIMDLGIVEGKIKAYHMVELITLDEYRMYMDEAEKVYLRRCQSWRIG